MDIVKKLGQNLKQIRLGKGLSQGKLAKKLGVDPSYISQIERGVNNLSLKKIEKLAKVLGVPIGYLIN